MKHDHEMYIFVNHNNIEVNMIRKMDAKLNNKCTAPNCRILMLDCNKNIYQGSMDGMGHGQCKCGMGNMNGVGDMNRINRGMGGYAWWWVT